MKEHKVIFGIYNVQGESPSIKMTDAMVLPEEMITIIGKQVLDSEHNPANGYQVQSLYGDTIITGIQSPTNPLEYA